MQQFRDYLIETYPGEDCYIDSQDRGWFSYKVSGEEFYINHIYVAPEFRGTSIISEFDEISIAIAKMKGCTYLSGTVEIGSNNLERSLVMQLKMGYKVHGTAGNVIILTKQI